VSRQTPHPELARKQARQKKGSSDEPVPHPPAEELVGASTEAEELKEPTVAAGVLVAETITFGDTAERLLEVLLVVLVGVLLSSHWDPRAVPLALLLFLVIRPLATLSLLAGTPTTMAQRWLMGWFGIRGIGSLYYLSYVLTHRTPGGSTVELAGLTISVVGLSILVHGTSARPLFALYERTLEEGLTGGQAAS
jgi:NhaP-type Na+/H+ or K+/H+ antiporter